MCLASSRRALKGYVLLVLERDTMIDEDSLVLSGAGVYRPMANEEHTEHNPQLSTGFLQKARHGHRGRHL